MASIYELKNEFLTLWAILEDEAASDEVIADAFDTATDDLKDKLENCCKYIKNEQALIEGLKAEEDRLKARREAKENAIDRLKKLMADAMKTAGEKKLPCGSFTCSIQANPPKTVIDVSIADIPEKYLSPQLPKVDTKALAADLKNPETKKELATIAHLEQGESLRIR